MRGTTAIKNYRISLPGGPSGYRELNEAAVNAFRAEGWTVELVGPSSIVVVDDVDD